MSDGDESRQRLRSKFAALGLDESRAEFRSEVVLVPTPDGTCDAVLVAPQGDAMRPAIIMYPDVVGLRPVKIAMAERLVAAGFVVLAVNQFYRTRPAPLFEDSFSMANPSDFAAAMQVLSTLDEDMVERDAAAFVDFLSVRPEVIAGSRMGALGFCMGGGMAIRTASATGDRVGCVISMHGGSLVSDKPNSPHRLLSKSSATYYIGVAADDDAKRPDDKVALADAIRAADLEGEVELYPDANHGWMVPDARAFCQPAAERGWSKLLATVSRALI